MSTSAVFRLMPPLSSFEKDAKLDLNSVRKALNAGDLQAAQQAFADFVKDAKARPGFGSQHPALRQDLQSLEQALKSGDLSSAQQAFAKFQQDSRVELSGSNGSTSASDSSSSEVSRFDVMA